MNETQPSKLDRWCEMAFAAKQAVWCDAEGVLSFGKLPRIEAPLTDRQTECLIAIERLMVERGIPPTLREVADVLGIQSRQGMVDHVAALMRKGWIVAEPRKTRTLQRVRSVVRLVPGVAVNS